MLDKKEKGREFLLLLTSLLSLVPHWLFVCKKNTSICVCVHMCVLGEEEAGVIPLTAQTIIVISLLVQV